MGEDRKEPFGKDPTVSVDPYKYLPDILNHIDTVIFENSMFMRAVVNALDGAGISTDVLKFHQEAFENAVREYWDFQDSVAFTDGGESGEQKP